MNRYLAVGAGVCVLMSLPNPAAAQAPQDPAAFHSRVENRLMELIFYDDNGEPDEGGFLSFPAPGRYAFSDFLDQPPDIEGDYTYENTGAATGTWVATTDEDGNDPEVYRFGMEMTFTSTTAGTALVFEYKMGRAEFVVDGTFRIIDATVPVLPVIGLVMLAVLLLVGGARRA